MNKNIFHRGTSKKFYDEDMVMQLYIVVINKKKIIRTEAIENLLSIKIKDLHTRGRLNEN